MLSALIATIPVEPSKVPFYVAGGVLVVYAVLVSAVGITRPSFPFGTAGARGVMAVSLALAAIAIAMAIVTS